jgi:hypothetical protein
VLQQFYSAFVNPHLKLLSDRTASPARGIIKQLVILKIKDRFINLLRHNKIKKIIVPRWRGPDVQ